MSEEKTNSNKTKLRIIEVLRQSIDEKNCIDIGMFRKTHPNEYSLLNHYFGSVDKAIETVSAIKTSKTNQRVKLRDKLAYDRLIDLRRDNTLEMIAKQYDVSRPGVNQLLQTLKNTVEKKVD